MIFPEVMLQSLYSAGENPVLIMILFMSDREFIIIIKHSSCIPLAFILDKIDFWINPVCILGSF